MGKWFSPFKLSEKLGFSFKRKEELDFGPSPFDRFKSFFFRINPMVPHLSKEFRSSVLLYARNLSKSRRVAKIDQVDYNDIVHSLYFSACVAWLPIPILLRKFPSVFERFTREELEYIQEVPFFLRGCARDSSPATFIRTFDFRGRQTEFPIILAVLDGYDRLEADFFISTISKAPIKTPGVFFGHY
jgi:hypothetical protein